MNSFFPQSYQVFLALFTCGLIMFSGCTNPAQGQLDSSLAVADASSITEVIQAGVREADLDGASLLAMQGDQVVYEEAFGNFSLDTVVPIASATKWISASVIMTLVDEGKLSLDAPISTYLPAFTGAKGKITLRQLLSHTSGLPSNHPCMNRYQDITLEECVNQIARVPLASDPGTEFRYGGASFQVAGRIAEVVSGQSWRTLFEERIKNPLGMTDSSYDSLRFGETDNPRIGGGAFSNLYDYRNLLLMHLQKGVFEGKQILSAAAIAEMHRDQVGELPVAASPVRNFQGYGLGTWIDLVDSQGNAVQLSSPGAFGFSPWIDVQRNLLGVFSVQDRIRNVAGTVIEVQQLLREQYESSQLLRSTEVLANSEEPPTFQWGRQVGGTGLQVARGVAADAAGNVWVTGSFNPKLTFQSSSESATSAGGQDFF